MRDALVGLNAEQGSQSLSEVAMRIGLHSGTVVAGSLGAKTKLKYTTMGDVVNAAARLESSEDCLLCAQCIKACGDKRGLGLYLRKPYEAEDRRTPILEKIITQLTQDVGRQIPDRWRQDVFTE